MKIFKPLVLSTLLFVSVCSLVTAEEVGPSYTVGGGMSPIYIEEQIKNSYLMGGLTVLPINTQISTGYTLNSDARIALQLSNNWYFDTQSRVIVSSLLAATGTYSPNNFKQVYMFTGAGLALKNRFATGEMNQGLGLLWGGGKKLTSKVSLEVSMQHLSFKKLGIDPQPGVSEDISSLQLSLVLLTF